MSTEISVSGNSNKLENPNSLNFEERATQLKEEEEEGQKQNDNAKKSPYKNFVQVNKDVYKAEDWLMSKSPIAYRIFRFLVYHMDQYNAVVCSYKVLEHKFDVSTPTVSRAVKLLKDKNFVSVYKSGTTNVYCLNKKIVWNSWGTNYKYGKFSANVLLSESEQEQQKKIKGKKQKTVEME